MPLAPETLASETLAPEQLERYARHILLKEIGGAGQKKLLGAKVLVIGAGGLGCAALSYLAAAGIGTIGVIDDDTITLSNLQRQILYTAQDIGEKKVLVAQKKLQAQNPDCTIIPYAEKLTAHNAADLISQYDIVADGCDNFPTRFLVNDACYFAKTPLVSAAVGRFDGQLATFKAYMTATNGDKLPCYRSLVPSPPPDDGESCAEVGIIGALVGVMGSLQAVEIIKEITGAGDSLAGRLLIYNGLTATARTVRLAWDAANPLNGDTPTLTDLSHHKI